MARTKIPIFLAAAVAGGLALGIPGAAAAQSVGFTVLPSDDGVYPPRPIKVENVVDPGVRPVIQNNEQAEPQTVCEGNNCNNNGWNWPQQNWQGWNWPQTYTNNDTTNGNAQPVVAPVGAGGNGGVVPVQNAAQSAQGAPEGVAEESEPTEEESEEAPEETSEEEAPEEESFEEGPGGMGPEETMGGDGPAPVAAGPAGGGQLPFTGAPVGVAAAGAGLLAVALGCTLVSARRRRSSGAE
ncbi:hypothetical protein [Microbispora sp. KK1-11]|uniref:hypothetical protein n=1 Tax=Microbispora sp. KK1-11 TaxID=2053005 RepID=UPI0011589581|nr:hypothetical protein [Microbispora sp. KK1-11]TQS29618.1 hypothetical protein FLW16_08295 [Microbispora sp. KK1-11]